jgi:hypothetical protein
MKRLLYLTDNFCKADLYPAGYALTQSSVCEPNYS